MKNPHRMGCSKEWGSRWLLGFAKHNPPPIVIPTGLIEMSPRAMPPLPFDCTRRKFHFVLENAN